ncbi:hypothetical protein ACJIZ3_007314 [Penstemon smallii]|uniref:Uncharacterized protein n=1 Tax=Penstemon smallii TaxID=265156 RepID=A0ABD3SA61_9LAMI
MTHVNKSLVRRLWLGFEILVVRLVSRVVFFFVKYVYNK